MATRGGYSSTQIGLHWIVAIIVAAQFLLADGMGEAWEAVEDGGPAVYTPLVYAHIAGGLAILALVLWRLSIRVGTGVPPAADSGGALLQKVATAVHWVFYILLIGLPLGGMAAWLGGIEAAGEVHAALTTVLLILIGLHVAGAIWHQFVLKDGLLRRMMRPES